MFCLRLVQIILHQTKKWWSLRCCIKQSRVAKLGFEWSVPGLDFKRYDHAYSYGPDYLNTKPFKIRTLKRLYLKCVGYLNVQNWSPSDLSLIAKELKAMFQDSFVLNKVK